MSNHNYNIYKNIVYILLLCQLLTSFKTPSVAEAPSSETALFSSAPFQDILQDLANDPHLSGITLGLSIQDSHTTYLNYNAKKLLRPASILKLLSTALAFKNLDSKTPFSTKIGHTGKIEKENLEGDLIIKGDSDPTFASSRYGGIEKALEEFVEALKQLSIKQITGDIVIDASHFEKAQVPESWAYEDLGNYYGAGATSLNFHENFYSIYFRLGKYVGEKTSILKIYPEIREFNLINEVTTKEKGSGDQAYIFCKEFSKDHIVRGTLPMGEKTYTIKGSLPNSAKVFLDYFIKHLQSHGITVLGKAKICYEKKDQKIQWIYTKKSPPLQEIAATALKHSINLYSEAFLKNVGLKFFNFASTDNGIKVFEKFLTSLGLNKDTFYLFDGSGLSHKNLISAESFTQALESLKSEKSFEDFLSSIPNASNYFAFSDLEDSIRQRVYIKSGSSSQILSFAGYIRTEKNKIVSFSFICNNCPKHRGAFYLLVKKLLQVTAKL